MKPKGRGSGKQRAENRDGKLGIKNTASRFAAAHMIGWAHATRPFDNGLARVYLPGGGRDSRKGIVFSCSSRSSFDSDRIRATSPFIRATTCWNSGSLRTGSYSLDFSPRLENAGPRKV